MVTQNPRIAAYVPQVIKEQFEAFKSERKIKGDSQALVAILSEYFGVSHQAAHQVSPDLIQRIEVLENRIDSLRDGLLSELNSRLLDAITPIKHSLDGLESNLSSVQQVKDKVRDEILSELKSESPQDRLIPGQLELIPHEESSETWEANEDEPSNELKSKPPDDERWMSTKECWEYLGRPGRYDTFRKISPEKLHQLYGVRANLERKAEKKYSAKWLSPSISSASSA